MRVPPADKDIVSHARNLDAMGTNSHFAPAGVSQFVLPKRVPRYLRKRGCLRIWLASAMRFDFLRPPGYWLPSRNSRGERAVGLVAGDVVVAEAPQQRAAGCLHSGGVAEHG